MIWNQPMKSRTYILLIKLKRGVAKDGCRLRCVKTLSVHQNSSTLFMYLIRTWAAGSGVANYSQIGFCTVNILHHSSISESSSILENQFGLVSLEAASYSQFQPRLHYQNFCCGVQVLLLVPRLRRHLTTNVPDCPDSVPRAALAKDPSYGSL